MVAALNLFAMKLLMRTVWRPTIFQIRHLAVIAVLDTILIQRHSVLLPVLAEGHFVITILVSQSAALFISLSSEKRAGTNLISGKWIRHISSFPKRPGATRGIRR